MAKKLHLVHAKSSVLGKAPSAETINYGEIAVNYNADSPALFIRDNEDNVVDFIARPYFEKIVGTGVTENDGETITPLTEIIQQDEITIAAAMNDLDDRKADKSYVDDAISASTIEIDNMLDTASTNPVQNKVVYQYILDNELTIAASLNNLNERKADKSYVDTAVSSVTIDIDDHMDSASTNPVENRVIWKVFHDDEKVTSAALNNLNDNKADKTYVDEAISGVTIEVDDHLDTASTRPVENRVVANALNNVSIDVDDHLDTASTKPVENRVIANALGEHAKTTIPDTGYTSSQMHLPEVTSTDNGKTLRVVDGEWALVEETNVYTGSGAPSQSLGNNGDIYLETS